LLKSGVVAAGWRHSHRPVLSRRPKRGSASAEETAESRGLSFKSRRDIGISKREKVPSWDGRRRWLGVPQDAELLSRSSQRWQCILACLTESYRKVNQGSRASAKQQPQTVSLKAVAILPLLQKRHAALKSL
jgi:hypothetical protein